MEDRWRAEPGQDAGVERPAETFRGGIPRQGARRRHLAGSPRTAARSCQRDRGSLGLFEASSLLQKLWSRGHRVNEEFNSFGFSDANLKQAGRFIRADQHREVIKLEDSQRVSVGVRRWRDSRQSHRIHSH